MSSGPPLGFSGNMLNGEDIIVSDVGAFSGTIASPSGLTEIVGIIASGMTSTGESEVRLIFPKEMAIASLEGILEAVRESLSKK